MKFYKNELEEITIDNILDIDEIISTKNLETYNNIKNEMINNNRDTFYIDEIGQIFIPIFGESNDYQYIGKCKI